MKPPKHIANSNKVSDRKRSFKEGTKSTKTKTNEVGNIGSKRSPKNEEK